jgi:hypothetical protein
MDKGADKPTQEELEAKAQKAADEAEALKPKPDEEPETPSEPAVEPTPAPSVPDEEPKPPKEEPDYKKKSIEQARENIILNAKNEKSEKLNKAVDEAAQITEIPEEEIKKDYPEWDDMTETEKRLAKENYRNNKRFEVIHKAALEGKNIEEWNKKVETFITDPGTLADNPDLEGKEEAFKSFAGKPTRRGVDFETLVSAFLHDESKVVKKNKGAMLEQGSGGPNDKAKPKSDKITLEQARHLRQTNYAKYTELLRAGKIESSDL